MSMSSTSTHATTFTIANARVVASKIKADLKLLQGAYGSPSDEWIEKFGEEAAQLLKQGYLSTVSYGYRRDGVWVVALKYIARTDGTLTADDRAGCVPRGVDVEGASFFSFMEYSSTWATLSTEQQRTVAAGLPVQRPNGTEPELGQGHWTDDRTYSSGGRGVARKAFRVQ